MSLSKEGLDSVFALDVVVSDKTLTVDLSDGRTISPQPPPQFDTPLMVRPEIIQSTRGLWLEVAAVITIGVLPHLYNAVFPYFEDGELSTDGYSPYGLDSLDLTFRSLCTTFLVLYVIYRSGEGWSKFGIVRLRWSDPFIGLALLSVSWVLWRVTDEILPLWIEADDSWPRPAVPSDYIWMVIANAANGFAEELVTRAYLITRLEYLLRSKFKAVIIAAAVFGSYHVYQGTIGVVDCTLFGLVYGSLYAFSRRVWPFAFGHMFANILLDLIPPH